MKTMNGSGDTLSLKWDNNPIFFLFMGEACLYKF